MSVYPENIGIRLQKASFNNEQIVDLKNTLPAKLIISVDGLAGVGKGTLGKNLSKVLEIPHLHTGLLYRTFTYIYEDQGFELNSENTAKVAELVDAKIANNSLEMSYKGEVLHYTDLNNKFIDTALNKYTSNLLLRQKVDECMVDIVLELKSPFVLDVRGESNPYQTIPEKNGFKVVRLILETDLEEKVQRRYLDHIKIAQEKDPNFHDTEENRQKVLKQCREAIVIRDNQDLESIKKTNIGLITPESAIINTTNLSIHEVLETALHFIKTEISRS